MYFGTLKPLYFVVIQTRKGIWVESVSLERWETVKFFVTYTTEWDRFQVHVKYPKSMPQDAMRRACLDRIASGGFGDVVIGGQQWVVGVQKPLFTDAD